MRRARRLPRCGPPAPLRRVLPVALAGVLHLLSGCYTYTLVQDPPVGSAARLRVRVQPAAEASGQSPESAAIEGRILSSGDTLALVASTRTLVGAFREVSRVDTLRFARDGVRSVEVRSLSVARSVALGAAVAAGSAALALAAFGTVDGGAGEGPGGGGSESFLSVLGRAFGAAAGLLAR